MGNDRLQEFLRCLRRLCLYVAFSRRKHLVKSVVFPKLISKGVVKLGNIVADANVWIGLLLLLKKRVLKNPDQSGDL